MRRTLIGSLLIAIPLLSILAFSLGGCGAIKRFTVVGGKKVNDVWMVDEMRIEKLEPTSDGAKSLSKTYLEILDVAD